MAKIVVTSRENLTYFFKGKGAFTNRLALPLYHVMLKVEVVLNSRSFKTLPICNYMEYQSEKFASLFVDEDRLTILYHYVYDFVLVFFFY